MSFNPLPFIISAVGIYFLVKLRFFFILHPIRTIGKSVRALKDKRALKSFSLALAGTLGVGNVFGVAFGIIVGGPGSLFWLFVSMFFAMIIKYAEVVISSDNLTHDRDTHGGMSYVIANSFKRSGRFLSKIYAVGIVGLSLVMGASLQCGTVAISVGSALDIPKLAIASFLVVITLFAITGGARKIEKVTSVVIPLTTIIYIMATLYIIISKASLLPSVTINIFRSAFEVRGVVGGALGFLLSSTFHEGFSRGILSNEAGAGTSSMAHARNGVLNPASSGLLGMLEVWFDTGLLCMLTGLSILLSVPEELCIGDGMELIMYVAGNSFGNTGKIMAAVSVFAFAFATVICWYYYGMETWGFVFGSSSRIAFLPIFIIFVVMGCFVNISISVFIIDALMATVSSLCVVALIKNSDRIKDLSERGGVIDCNIGKRYRKGIRGSVLPREEQHREH